MQQYIMFKKDIKGVNGYLYQKQIKYKIKKQNENYYYVMSDKIQKDKLDKVKYVIDDIKEAR